MSKDEEFHFRLNDRRRVRKLAVKTGIYQDAVAAIPAMFGIQDFPLKVTIWAPRLVDAGYGPYDYMIERDACGHTIVRHHIRWLRFTINGQQHHAAWDAKLSYDAIVRMAWPNRVMLPEAHPTIVYNSGVKSYTLTPGCEVTLKDGMRIDCAMTDAA